MVLRPGEPTDEQVVCESVLLVAAVGIWTANILHIYWSLLGI